MFQRENPLDNKRKENTLGTMVDIQLCEAFNFRCNYVLQITMPNGSGWT